MRLLRILKRTVASWSEDNAFRLAAALAYYGVFSLAPLLIIAIAVAGAVFGSHAAQGEAMGQIQNLIGPGGAQAVRAILLNAHQPHAGLTAASLLGILSLIFGATGVFVSLQDGLNTIWQVKPKPTNMVLGFLRQRLHTFILVLGVGLLLLVSLVASAAISTAGKFLDGRFSSAETWQTLNFAISFAVVTLLFALIFKLLPDVRIRWRDVWVGAAVTAMLFTIGKFLIGMYIGRGSFTSVYGAAGSVVLILAWVYYSSLILFFGAEFTRIYADEYGGRAQPADNAEPLTPEARAQQGLEPYTAPERRRPAA